MKHFSCLLTILVGYLTFDSLVSAKSATGDRALAILQHQKLETSHSQLLQGLKDRGFTLDTVLASDSDIKLIQYGDRLYDHVLLLAPTVDSYGGLSADDVKHFVEDGGNVFIAGGRKISSTLRDLVAEFGIDVGSDGSQIFDHFAVDATDKGDDTRIVTSVMSTSSNILGPLAAVSSSTDSPVSLGQSEAAILYSGVAHTVQQDSVLIFPLLAGGPTSYASDKKRPVSLAGSDALLVSAVQGRNNARVVFTGSVWSLSDEAFKGSIKTDDNSITKAQSANADFYRRLLEWNFQERGVLRASNVSHSRADGAPPEHLLKNKPRDDLPRSIFADPEVARESLVYRAKDDLRYTVDIAEWNPDQGEWQPYVAEDVQLEFVMLDAYVRSNLTVSSDGKYETIFKAPDQHGIYKFRIMYRRPGLTVLKLNDQVSIRPFAHNEYDRFLTTAYPYYTAVFVLMGSFYLIGFVFLYTK